MTQTRFTADCLARTYNLKKGIKIIYSGIDETPVFYRPENPVLLTGGNFLENGKNLDLLLKIAHKLPNNIKIKILGNYKTDRKFPANIEFLTGLTTEELQEAYQNSSIYLALSGYNSSWLPSIRAAGAGCAILANDVPVLRELWGDCASIFERDSVNSLIRCINNLAENKNLLEITSKNCQAKALCVFNARRMAYEYINLYKSLLRKF